MTHQKYKREDFSNDAEVRWCPGCGDYAILAAIQRMLPELGLAPEKHVFISGIGCAGRLPYYMNTYGFHTIHGRALAVATGLKALRDDLTVWVITGDGDALSIGGNHLIHCLRRNVNVNILLVNNQVYGLTKGQFSPTSQPGQITKTSPQGVNVQPVNPLTLALSAGASFVARAVDKDPVQLGIIMREAYEHQGCSLIEIYQDCHIFNEGAFDEFSLKTNRLEHTIPLQAGKPLLYGKDQSLGLTIDNDELKSVNSQEAMGYLHDPTNFMSAMRLARLSVPKYPVPLGVYYKQSRDTFRLKCEFKKTSNDLPDLFRERASWTQD